MKGKISNIFWGIVLILVSGALLAQALGYIDFEDLSDQVWTLVFAGASLLFFLSYFLNGVKNWGWLFPAFIFAGLALTIWLATNDFDGSYLGAPILAAIAIPFYVGFAVERKSWGLLIPAFVLTVISLITIIADTAPGEWIGAIVLLSIGLPFLVVFILDRNKRWALIPATILIVLSIVTLVSTFAAGEWIGALVLYAVGLIFLGIFLFDHSKRWALVPAAVLAVVGTIPLIAAFTGGDLTGTVVMFLFALPFFVIYFWSKNNWWALIPGGVFASIGLVVLLSMLLPKMDKIWEGFFGGIFFLGLTATFAVLWLRRKTQPTDWAKYPAAGLLAAAVLAFILGNRFDDFWPAAVLLVVGVMLLLTAFRKRAENKPVPEEKQ